MTTPKNDRPAITADAVLCRVRDGTLEVGLVKRDEEAVEGGKWCLPGGFVPENKPILETLQEKMKQKAGITSAAPKSFTFYDNLRQGERWRVISCIYIECMPSDEHEHPGFKWVRVTGDTVDADGEIAFNHEAVIKEAVAELRTHPTDYAFNLLPTHFTIREIQTVFEAIEDKKRNNFTRFIKPYITPSGQILQGRPCRPAAIYTKA